MSQFSPDFLQLGAGAALGLFGWTCYWGGLHLVGALLGVSLGVGVAYLGIRAGEVSHSIPMILTICGALGAVLGVFLIRQIHKGFFLLTGALAGLIVGLQAALFMGHAFPEIEWLKPLGAATGIIAGSLLFLLLSRHIIILITAFFSALLIATAYVYRDPLLIFLVTLFVSLIIQTGVVRRLGFSRH